MNNISLYSKLSLPVFILLLSCAGPALFGQAPVDKSQSDSILAFKESVEKEKPKSITVSGEFKSYVQSELGMQVKGRVKSVYVDTGDSISKGQLLLELENDYLEIDRRRVEAELTRSKALLLEAERDFNRKNELAARKSVSLAVLERSESRLAQSKAGVALAEVAVDLNAQKLKDSRLLSPISGVVQERLIDIGEKIGDNSVTFILVEIAPLRLQFRIPEQYLASVHVGDQVQVRVSPYPDEMFPGAISVVGKVIDARNRTFLVEAHFKNESHRLSPGLFAKVTLIPSTGGDHAETR
jgi:membrane fusion protein (multidrug efflux system)